MRINKLSSRVIIVIYFVLFSTSVAIASDKSGITLSDSSSKGTSSFSFVVLGHPRGKVSNQLSEYIDEIIESIAELKPDFLILTGDIIYGFTGKPTDPDIIRAEWEKFDAKVNVLGIPIYRVPGNHDVHNRVTRDVYFNRYHQVPFAFTFGGCRFVLLDTIDVNQQSEEDQTTWSGDSQSFDDEQLEFVRNEIEQQNSYDHLFFFMHHPQPWSEPSGFWWRDVHPLLFGGKTRAVFAGSPWYFKYAHLEQDGIHYILSSCMNDPDPSRLRRYPSTYEISLHKQLNNFQYVHVNGDSYTIDTIVIGALSSEVLSWRFWDQIDERSSKWARRLAFRLRMRLSRPRNLLLIAIMWGGFFFILGILITALWARRRN